MYGEIVKIDGYDVWVNCLPTTSKEEKLKKAQRKLSMYLDGELNTTL